MKAIVTKTQTNYRIRATAEGVPVCIVPRPDGLDRIEDEHHYAARELCRRMNWTGYLIGGGMPDGRSMVWTFLPREHPALMSLAEVVRLTEEDWSPAAISAACNIARGVLHNARAVAEGVL